MAINTELATRDDTYLDIYKDEFIKKSNIFISSKYNSTLLENKVLALACNKRERHINPDNTYRVEIPASEIKIMLRKAKNNNSVYSQLATVADSLTGHKMYFMDIEKHRFKITTLVHTATYEDGVLSLDFPESTIKLIDNDVFGFTKLPLGVLFRFSSVQSFRLYEQLKSKAYLLERKRPGEEIFVQWTLAELKINCACVDTDEEDVKKALQSESPDFDKIVNQIAKTVLYREWRDFKKNVLERAKTEINKISDIHIEYETFRSNRGGKISEVVFRVSLNAEYRGESTTSCNTFEDFSEELDTHNRNLFEVIKYFQEHSDNQAIIKPTTVKRFLKYADNDVQLIKDTFDLACQQPAINDIVGWMISAIKERYVDSKKEERSIKYGGYTDTEEAKNEIAKKAWANMQTHPYMKPYMEYISEVVSEEIFDMLSASEKVDDFFAWKHRNYKKLEELEAEGKL